ncbi:hypothetical protein AVEN_37443-1 [Araneus ventricosus]|uniref:Uncharacterized protein n=1 Tax=Araneus ventricosus TaxID=182803 RepID=A0A4Y2FBS6_ARAVE|nr:hypothetical protein AVEN_37443-1 [Araneus ventricosus]
MVAEHPVYRCLLRDRSMETCKIQRLVRTQNGERPSVHNMVRSLEGNGMQNGIWPSMQSENGELKGQRGQSMPGFVWKEITRGRRVYRCLFCQYRTAFSDLIHKHARIRNAKSVLVFAVV